MFCERCEEIELEETKPLTEEEKLEVFRSLDEIPQIIINNPLAIKIGLDGSLIIQKIMYLINEVGLDNYHEDKFWVSKTYRQWREYFPFFTYKQLRRIFHNLKKDGYILVSNFDKNRFRKSNWYTLNNKEIHSNIYEKIMYYLELNNSENFDIFDDDCPNGQIEVPKWADRSAQMGRSKKIGVFCQKDDFSIKADENDVAISRKSAENPSMALNNLSNTNTNNINILYNNKHTQIQKEKKNKNPKNKKKEKVIHVLDDSLTDKTESPEDLFAKFWSLYPNKADKKRARGVFIKSLSKCSGHDIISSLIAKIEENEKCEKAGVWVPFWKHPTTWLNGECWNDEIKTDEQIEQMRKKSSSNLPSSLSSKERTNIQAIGELGQVMQRMARYHKEMQDDKLPGVAPRIEK